MELSCFQFVLLILQQSIFIDNLSESFCWLFFQKATSPDKQWICIFALCHILCLLKGVLALYLEYLSGHLIKLGYPSNYFLVKAMIRSRVADHYENTAENFVLLVPSDQETLYPLSNSIMVPRVIRGKEMGEGFTSLKCNAMQLLSRLMIAVANRILFWRMLVDFCSIQRGIFVLGSGRRRRRQIRIEHGNGRESNTEMERQGCT